MTIHGATSCSRLVVCALWIQRVKFDFSNIVAVAMRRCGIGCGHHVTARALYIAMPIGRFQVRGVSADAWLGWVNVAGKIFRRSRIRCRAVAAATRAA